MRKIVCNIALLCCAFGLFGQETTNPKKFEAKLNAFNLLVFEYFDLSGEYLINEESSVGLSILVNFNQGALDDDGLLFDRKRSFSVTPYYRQYLSRSYAKGFFFEAFGMLNAGTQYEYDYITYTEFTSQDQPFISNENTFDYTNFGFGFSIGGKWVTERGFTFEIYSGLGRNLIGKDLDSDLITRGGIGIGYRF